METQLSLVNKVLVRLREDEVTSTSASAYAALITQFVRQAVDEVEDATDWIQLRATIALPTLEDIFVYSLSGAGTGFRILQVFENTQDYDLRKPPSYAWMNRQLLTNNVQKGSPEYYDVNGQDINGDALVNLFPVPDGTYQVNVNLVVKSHMSDDADSTPLPYLPILLRAYMLAIDERGDDGGDSLVALDKAYTDALSDAVAIDASRYEDETVWYED